MKRDNLPWGPAAQAQVEWQLDVPRSAHFDDLYFSAEDGRAESEHTFLAGNGLPARWRGHTRPHFCIAETGFGTGLNFLVTWRSWRDQPGPRPDLHYLSLEQYPLERAALARALGAWPGLADEAGALLANYPPPLPGWHRVSLDGGRVRLDLCWGEAGEALADLARTPRELVDAWYLDGFAPAKNPGMWTPALFAYMARLGRPGATVATFTAAGDVRRGLQRAGFDMHRETGFGRKRECLRGELRTPPPTAPPGPADTPWDLPAHTLQPPRDALVIGAGLAGAHVAAALAARGIEVTVLDAGDIADGASGNAQGVLYTRLSRRHSALTDFALMSFLHATRLYQAMFEADELRAGLDGELCGGFHACADGAELEALGAALERMGDVAQVVDAPGAAALLGVVPATGGYWFPAAGWLHPPAVCAALLARDNVTVTTGCGPVSLARDGNSWVASGDAAEIARAECAVITAGGGSPALAGLDWLPVQSIRGQTTELPVPPALEGLSGVLCDEGYIAPARNDVHCIGATFDIDDRETRLRSADHKRNLEALGRAIPATAGVLSALDTEALSGRVGWRCASPDYLPMAGPVPDLEAFVEDYAELRRNAKRAIDRRGRYLPGLFLSTAHGSRGLTSTPLAAELVASAACDEPPPLERALRRALSPARFPIRDLARGRR